MRQRPAQAGVFSVEVFRKRVVCSQFIRAATAEKPVIFIKFVVWQSWFTDFILEAAQVDCPPVPRPFQPHSLVLQPHIHRSGTSSQWLELDSAL